MLLVVDRRCVASVNACVFHLEYKTRPFASDVKPVSRARVDEVRVHPFGASRSGKRVFRTDSTRVVDRTTIRRVNRAGRSRSKC